MQHRTRPRRELHLGAIAPELPGSGVETKQAKCKLAIRGHARAIPDFPGNFPELRQYFRLLLGQLSHAVSTAAIEGETANEHQALQHVDCHREQPRTRAGSTRNSASARSGSTTIGWCEGETTARLTINREQVELASQVPSIDHCRR